MEWINGAWVSQWVWQLVQWTQQAHLMGLMSWVSDRASFSFPLLGGLLIYLLYCYGRQGLWIWLTTVLLVVGLGNALVDVLKAWFALPRPCAVDPSLTYWHWLQSYVNPCQLYTGFPSAHAWNFAAATVFLIGTVQRSGLSWLFVIVTCLVVVSRVVLLSHFPYQAIVGALGGLLWGWLWLQWWRFYQRRQQRFHKNLPEAL